MKRMAIAAAVCKDQAGTTAKMDYSRETGFKVSLIPAPADTPAQKGDSNK